MRELNPENIAHGHRGLFRFVLGNAQIFAAGLGTAFMIQLGPTSWWTIAAVCGGVALAGISVVTRHAAHRARKP